MSLLEVVREHSTLEGVIDDGCQDREQGGKAGVGSRALDFIGALVIRSWTCFGVRTANSDREVGAVVLGNETSP